MTDKTYRKGNATMKPLQGDSVNSCSCTSCDSKSESNSQTLKRLLRKASRINRLLNGKYYIHLRDSNLLDKLIKTRALYDALRSQLLSTTESSTADLKTRQSSRKIRKAFVEAKESSDIFTLVDLVDKGAVIGLKKLSECCSCCTCSSKFRLHENVQKGRRNRQAHAGGYIASRSSFVSKQETGEAKNIKSDPCTCACYKHKNIKQSREITEKIRPGQQIIERDGLSTAANNHKLMSLNNGKLRKSYHKLKRANGRSPYIENIGEGGNKTMRKSNRVQEIAIKETKSIELLKLAEKTIINSFENDRQTLKKKEPVAIPMIGNTGEESMIPVKNTTAKSKDLVGKRQAQSPVLKKRLAQTSRKINRSRKENTNECMCKISDTSSTSNTSIVKETQKKHSRPKKSNKKLLQQPANLAESNTENSKKPYALGGSNQVQKSKESKIPPQNDPAEVVNNKNKNLPFSSTPGKELIKSNTVTITGIESHPASYNKTSSNSLNKINKSILKPRSSVLIRKRIRMLSLPLRFRPHPPKVPSQHKEPARHNKLHRLHEVPRLSEEPRRHKNPSVLKQKNIKSDSHALKRCTCTLTLKMNENKSRMNKNVSNKNHNVKDKQSINSKNLLPSVKTLKRPTQNETNAHLEIKYNVFNDKKSIQYDRAQDVTIKKKLSIHASISDCICKQLEEFMSRHGRPNIAIGVKSTSNHQVSNNLKKKTKIQGEHADTNNSYNIISSIHASECESFDANISSEENGRYKNQRGKSNTRLRTKSGLKDASITSDKPRKLQNKSDQTVINITAKQKQEIEISLKQLEKKTSNTCNPRFSTELFNKGYSNNGLKITQSKVKFINKCGVGTKQLPNKQSQTSSSTQRSKVTCTKHGLRRCFCTLQLGKQQKKKYNKSKLSKVTMIQPKINVEGSHSQAELKLVSHDKLPYKYDFSICSPKECFSWQLNVALIKREERNSKKSINTKLRSGFSLTSRSLQLPRTKNIRSILISPNSEILTSILKRNKTQSSDISTHRVKPIFSRKLFKSKRSSCLHSPIDKYNKINKDTKISYSKELQKTMTLRNKKQGQSLLLDLTNKRCLCTFKLCEKGKEKINPKYSNQLKPYKSKYLEPFVLEKNKRNTFKNFGIVTEKTKMKSKSSDTRTLRSTSKLLFVKSDLQQRNTSLQKIKKMRKYSELSHLPQHAREMYLDNFFKQTVKMGSNFNFNIEFYKDVTPKNNFNQNRSKNMNVHFLHNKQEGNFLTKRYSSNQNTHLGIKRVSPTSNRCLCTLKISKMDEQRRNSKLLLPLGTKKLSQVYAMSTVAIAENKIKTPEILEVGHDFHYIDSYYPTYSKNASCHTKQWQYFKEKSTSGLSLSMIAFKTKNVQSYIRESKYKLLQISSRDQSLLDFASNESVRFETAFSCEIDYLKNICSKKRRILRSAQSQNDTLALRQRTTENPETEKAQNITRLSQITGVQPLLKRCYCTMNIQVARQKRKLLDYECEPGICIPGECDPYECQKLIMKRLMRQVSRMSGTENRSRSSSSETHSTSSRTRRLQSGYGEPRVRKHRTGGHYPRSRPTYPQGLKYQTLPRAAKASAPAGAGAHRQAVRVGSTFSFDIKFSKDMSKSAPTTDFVRVPKRQTSSRYANTYPRHGMDRGTKYGDRRHHRETQSMMKHMRHRASNVTPMLKRCFCTLKLQKKGRQQKEWELRGTDHGTSTPPKFSVEKPFRRTTERGQNTRRKRRFPELLPYECEPGICVPGECDPYECLELIKRRNKHTKDFGTESMASSISSSSMTSGQKRKRKRIQARNIRAKQVRSIDTSIRSRPSVISIDRSGQERQVQDRQPQDRPSRQAVKISSNFSFNVEFYKDKGGPSSESDRRASEVYDQGIPRRVRKAQKNVYAHRRMRESSSQHGKRTRDGDSQIGIYQRGRSTMTRGFLKRCFCTAKLQGINVDASTRARHRPLAKLIQCICPPKLMSASKRRRRGSNVGHERATPILHKRVGMTQTRGRFAALLPYECEPGVCEPGSCDPHECIKLIRKRLAKEKMTGTAGPRTTSTSSYFSSVNPSRARMTQSRSDWPKSKMTQFERARRRERGRRRDYAPRERVLQETYVSSVSPERQAVRIGSNFSFNIEFYKDKGSNDLDVQTAAPLGQRSRPIRMKDRGRGAYRRTRTRDRGLRGRRFPTQSRDSQMDPTISRDVGLGPILKRCFCTLKLQKQSKTKGKTKVVTNAASNAETKPDTSAEAKTIDKETESKKKKKAKQKKTWLSDLIKTKNECTCTPPIKEIATLHTKSVMTAKKRRRAFPYKLEPYECEPGICVPGECDPYECLKLINKRLMYSSGTSTDRRGTRSTSNMTHYGRGHRHRETQSFMQRKKPMRTRDTRTRDRERKPYRERAYREGRAYRQRQPESRSAEYRSTVGEKGTKQAVKLGSSFNVDIEFFKDKSHGGPGVVSRPIKRDGPYDKPRRTSSRSTEWRPNNFRNRRAQFSRANRDMDSQVLGSSMRSSMTGTAAPFLKRCFCTLQLHCKTENQRTPFDYLSDIGVCSKKGKVKPQAKQESSSAETNASYIRKKAQFLSRKLKPTRKMLSKQSSTESYKYRSTSNSTTDREKRKKPRRLQARSYGSRSISSSSNKTRKHRPRKKPRSYSPNWRNSKSQCDDDRCLDDTSNERQALCYGSEFNCSMEFFKEKHHKLPQVPSEREVYKGVKKDEKYNVNRRRAKRETVAKPFINKIGEKNNFRDVQSQSQLRKNNVNERRGKRQTMAKAIINKIGEKFSFRDVQSQSQLRKYNENGRRAKKETVAKSIVTKIGEKLSFQDVQSQSQLKTKGTGTPLLKRCFCTLKLEKKGKQWNTPTKIIEPSFKCVSTYTKSKTLAEIQPVAREIGTKTKNKNCKCYTQKQPVDNIPKAKKCKCPKAKKVKSCECKKKKKNCKCSESCECVFEKKSEKKAEADEFPCKEGKACTCCKCNTYYPGKLINESNVFPCKKGKDCKCCKCNTCAGKSIEYPCKKGKGCKCCKCNALKENEPVSREIGTKNKNCKCYPQQLDKCKCDNSPKAEIGTKTKTKNKNCKCYTQKPGQCKCENIPKAEKCKCDLKKNKTCKCNESCLCKKVQAPEIVKTSETVKTSVKQTSPKEKYSPLQKFDPCVCEKDVREPGEKGIRRMSGTPDMRRKHHTSRVSNIAAQFIPGYTHKRTKYHGGHYSPENIERVVEQPRYPFLHGKDAKQGVKITSDFSFNVEFFKELLPPVVEKKPNDKQGSNFRKSIFQPKEYWVQYQTQQTKKYFKTNPQELETIMSYAPSRYYKINNNKERRCSCKTNFGRVDPTKKGAHLKGIPKHSETKQSTLKKMFYYCKNVFTKRSDKQNIKNTEECMEFKKKATNKLSLFDILKPSNSERHPNKAAIADIKKTKSLKVARGSGKDYYKNKYSRYQSGDYQGTKSQNTGIKLKKKYIHCQHEKVRFTSALRTNKALKYKPNDAIVTEQKMETKPVSFLFKSLQFKNFEDLKYLKLCSCCGGMKRVRNLPAARNNLDIKKKLLEYSEDAITTVIPKDLIAIPTKIDIPKEGTALTEEHQKKNKQACSCCVCKSVSKPKTEQGKKGGLGVCGSIVCKREPEKLAENTHHAECIKCKHIRGSSICPAESEKEVFATEFGCYRAPNQKKTKIKLGQDAKTRGNFHKAKDKEIIEKKIKDKCKSKKLTKYKNMADSLLVAESVLDIDKLELTTTKGIVSNIHRAFSDPKDTYRKCQLYLRNLMRAWDKFQKPANNGPSVEKLQFFNLRCQEKKSIEEIKETLEDYPGTNFAKHSNNTDRKKGFHPKKPSWRRHPGCGFGWSPFMLSLRKRPWLSSYYKCAGSYPHCLTILQVWRQFMDIILFLLAVAVLSPCLLGIKLCRVLKCCFLCMA